MKLIKYITFMLLPFIAVASLAAAEIGKVIAQEATGVVVVSVAGVETPLAAGEAIPVGSTVKTGKKSIARIAFSNGTIIALAENSEIVIHEFVQAGTGNIRQGFESYAKEPAGTVSNMKVGLNSGMIYVQIAKQNAGSGFSVSTPAGTVYGTKGASSMSTFSVHASLSTRGNSTMTVSAISGSFRGATTAGAICPINEGQTVVIEAGSDTPVVSLLTQAQTREAVVMLAGRDPLDPSTSKDIGGDDKSFEEIAGDDRLFPGEVASPSVPLKK